MFLHELCKIGHPISHSISHSAHRIFLAAIYKHLVVDAKACQKQVRYSNLVETFKERILLHHV